MSLLQKGVRELRFIMCQQSAASQGVRSYVLNNYQSVKASNPEFPFIVREAKGAQPCITARYEFGVERRVYVHNATEAEIAQTIDELVG
jgi:NADH dehydrogenase (ubiquinone) 1 alpha subcomplex subunit 2